MSVSSGTSTSSSIFFDASSQPPGADGFGFDILGSPLDGTTRAALSAIAGDASHGHSGALSTSSPPPQATGSQADTEPTLLGSSASHTTPSQPLSLDGRVVLTPVKEVSLGYVTINGVLYEATYRYKGEMDTTYFTPQRKREVTHNAAAIMRSAVETTSSAPIKSFSFDYKGELSVNGSPVNDSELTAAAKNEYKGISSIPTSTTCKAFAIGTMNILSGREASSVMIEFNSSSRSTHSDDSRTVAAEVPVQFYPSGFDSEYKLKYPHGEIGEPERKKKKNTDIFTRQVTPANPQGAESPRSTHEEDDIFDDSVSRSSKPSDISISSSVAQMDQDELAKELLQYIDLDAPMSDNPKILELVNGDKRGLSVYTRYARELGHRTDTWTTATIKEVITALKEYRGSREGSYCSSTASTASNPESPPSSTTGRTRASSAPTLTRLGVQPAALTPIEDMNQAEIKAELKEVVNLSMAIPLDSIVNIEDFAIEEADKTRFKKLYDIYAERQQLEGNPYLGANVDKVISALQT